MFSVIAVESNFDAEKLNEFISIANMCVEIGKYREYAERHATPIIEVLY